MPNIPPSIRPNWYSIEFEIIHNDERISLHYFFQVNSALIIQEFYNEKGESILAPSNPYKGHVFPSNDIFDFIHSPMSFSYAGVNICDEELQGKLGTETPFFNLFNLDLVHLQINNKMEDRHLGAYKDGVREPLKTSRMKIFLLGGPPTF
jgi:hypothetical protein